MTTQSPDSGELRALVEECDDFSQCGDCGTHVVNLATHRCPPPDRDSPNRATREARADCDPRDCDDLVGVFRRSVGNPYAYHELDDDDVYCGCGEYTKASRLDVVPRSRAKSLGRSPCGNCSRLRSLRDDE